jgi:hypothetical protein
MTPEDPKERPVDWARLRQRYASLTYRRRPILDGLVFLGIVVEAADPRELAAETGRVLVERSPNGEPS